MATLIINYNDDIPTPDALQYVKKVVDLARISDSEEGYYLETFFKDGTRVFTDVTKKGTRIFRIEKKKEVKNNEKVTTYRVPQLMSKKITVVCVDGIPICTVRGKKSCSDIIAKLQGYEVTVIDERIDKLIERIQKGKE